MKREESATWKRERREVNVPHPMTRRSLIVKAAAALAAPPVGTLAARSAEASAAAPSVAHGAVLTLTSMQVGFDDLPYLMSSVLGPPKVSTDDASMTHQFVEGEIDALSIIHPSQRFEPYFDYLRDSWRIYDHAVGEVIRDYPCDACVQASVEDGEFWAERLAVTVARHLNAELLSVEDVKSWPAIARPTVVTPVILDGEGDVKYVLAQGFPDSWDVPAPDASKRPIVTRDFAFGESATTVFIKSGGAWKPLDRVIGVVID